MNITVRPQREEAIKAGFASLAGRLPADMSLEDFSAKLADWDVRAFCDGDRAVGMLMTKGPELHVAVLPEVRGKWLSRRLIREVFRPLLSAYGAAQTRVMPENETGKDFVSRLGFEGRDVLMLRDGFATGAFDPVTAAVTGGTALVGGFLGNEATKQASRDQKAATDQALGEQARQYNQTRADMAPYREAGSAAISRIRDLLGLSDTPAGAEDILRSDPGYTFRFNEGLKGVMNPLKAAGLSKSGAALKAVTRYGQDYATNAYDSVINRLAGLAGTGQSSSGTLGMLGSNYAGNVGNLLTAGANARGAAGIAGANMWANGLGAIGNYYGQSSILDKILNRGGGGVTVSGGGGTPIGAYGAS